MNELMDLDMEPKPEWWTSTHKDEVGATFKVGGRDRSWETCRSWKNLTCWDIGVEEMGRVCKRRKERGKKERDGGGGILTSSGRRVCR